MKLSSPLPSCSLMKELWNSFFFLQGTAQLLNLCTYHILRVRNAIMKHLNFGRNWTHITPEFIPIYLFRYLFATRAGRFGDPIQVGRNFPPVQTGPGAHPASCTMGTGSFPGVKYGRGVLLTTHPLLVPRSWKSRAIPLPTLWATKRPVTRTLYLTYLFANIH